MNGSVDSIDLFDPVVQEEWYGAYDALRTLAPVWRMPGTGHYLLSRFADVQFALRRPDLFPNAEPGQNPLIRSARARAIYDEGGLPRHSPLGSNPPIHRAYRATVDSWFNAAGAERARPMITRVVDELVGEWIADGYIEFIGQFALPLPLIVITSLLGFPLEDIPSLKKWSEAWVLPFAVGLTEDQEVWVAEQGVEFGNYVLERLAEKRLDPGDDVLSHLAIVEVEMPEGRRPLTPLEIVNIIEHLYIGGNETTTFALASGMWLMLRQPDLQGRLVDDPSLIPTFVEEVLRLESPTQGLWRMVAQDVELSGTVIPAGSVVHLRYGAANRDERMFAEPNQLDLSRTNAARHLAFASGEHRCPGAELSRVEQRVAFERLLSRLAEIHLTPGRNDFTHHRGFVLRALKELHISFRPAA
jgi:cytochrome P450